MSTPAPSRALLVAALVRAGGFLATVAGGAALLQALLVLAPGDPVDLIPGGEELRPQLVAEWHLDRPPWVRLGLGLWDALRGDLGTSLTVRPGAAVVDLLAAAGGRSLGHLLGAGALLGLSGLALALLGRRWPASRTLPSLLSLAPVFLLGWMGVTVLNALAWAGMEAGWWARPGWFALPDQDSGLRTALGLAVLAVGSGALADLQGAIEDELGRLGAQPWVDGLRGLGLRPGAALVRNLLPALAALGAARLSGLVGGLVVTERLLGLGGAGALLWEAALKRDYPLAFGLGLGAAGLVAALQLLADWLRLWLDPRLQEEIP